jgi:small multidrug resistance pump
MHWLLLTVAIFFEVSGTVCMKLSQGFTRLTPSVLIFVFYGLCFVTLTYAMKKIELSVAYAIWSGLGMAIITLVGYLYFKEALGPLRLVFVALIIVGVLGLKLTS